MKTCCGILFNTRHIVIKVWSWNFCYWLIVHIFGRWGGGRASVWVWYFLFFFSSINFHPCAHARPLVFKLWWWQPGHWSRFIAIASQNCYTKKIEWVQKFLGNFRQFVEFGDFFFSSLNRFISLTAVGHYHLSCHSTIFLSDLQNQVYVCACMHVCMCVF